RMTDERTPALVAVIEDDDASRRALARLLRASGFDTALFESAETFMAAPPSEPLCLILDVRLGGISGLDLQHRLRSEGSAIPIIVTTGQRDEATRHRATENGCTAFLWKPVDADALLDAIGSIERQPRADL